jgi:transcriptional regulator with GAF, ATPase, and Fis domain
MTNQPVDDLTTSLIELASIVADGVGFQATLQQIANYAATVHRDTHGAAITMSEGGRPSVLVATEPLVGEAEQLQYDIAEGPALTATSARHAIVSGSLGGDENWPRFGPRVGRMGLHSVIAVPLMVHDLVVGTMAIYSLSKNAFSAADVRAAERYAGPASAVARNAMVLDRLDVEVTQLTTALRSRPVIDQAIGIIMSRSGKSAEQCFATLRRESNNRQLKVSEVAQRLVDEAVRRAVARRQDEDDSVRHDENDGL